MAKTYDQIQSQIHKLQQQADALKAKEAPGVIARIRGAISHYGLTPDDLFGEAAVRAKRQPATRLTAKPAKPGKAAMPAKALKSAKPVKAPSPAKYQDDAGHQWSGVGKRPNWFKDAIAAGKTAEALLVKKPA